jgi:hypothetical protein
LKTRTPRERPAGRKRGTIAALAFVALCSCAEAQSSDSPLKSAAKTLGFATDVGPPADFVTATRPKGQLDYIPVFAAPDEPPRPALDATAQKAISDDLEATNRRAEALRGGFASAQRPKPAAKKPLAKPPVAVKAPATDAQ